MHPRKMVEVVILLIFLGRLKTQPFYEIKEIHNNSYVVATKPLGMPDKVGQLGGSGREVCWNGMKWAGGGWKQASRERGPPCPLR